MADEQNLNGLAGGMTTKSTLSAGNAARGTADALMSKFFNPAKAASAEIRRNMEATERAAANAARSIAGMRGGTTDLSGFDVKGGHSQLGGGNPIMARPTISTNAAGQSTLLSSSRTIMPTGQSSGTAMQPYQTGGQVMPYGNQSVGGYGGGPQFGGQRALPAGNSGWRTGMATFGGNGGGVVAQRGPGGQIMPYGNQGGGDGGDGGVVSNGGGFRFTRATGMAAAGVALGGAVAYGASKLPAVYGRDMMAQSMASMTGGTASQYYSGQYATIMGQTSTSDELQGRGALNRMGFLPGSSQYNNLQKQMSTMAQQTGFGAGGSGAVMQNLMSANVSNRGRAMLGINTRDSNGVMKDYNTLAKQIMGKLYTGGGKGPTNSDVAAAIAPGRSIDYALDQLGMSGDAKLAVENSMLAQSQGGGGLGSLNVGKSGISKQKSVATTSNTEGANESGAVAGVTTFNKAANDFKAGVEGFMKMLGLNGPAGAVTGFAGSAGGGLLGFLGIRSGLKLLGKGASSMGKGAGSDAEAVLQSFGHNPQLAEGARIGGSKMGLIGAALSLAPDVVGAVSTAKNGGGAGSFSGSLWDQMTGNAKATGSMKLMQDANNMINPVSQAAGAFRLQKKVAGWIGSAFSGSDGAGQSSGGGGSNTAGGGSAAGAVSIAMKYLGQPYVWGGNEPGGFDCSGLVQYVYKQLGVSLPHHAADQARCGTEVGSLAQAVSGDLLFFGTPVHHVAIYIGNGKMIAAPHTGANVQVQNVYGGISHIRRVLGNSSSTDGKNSNNLTVGMGASGGGTTNTGGGSSSTGLSGSSIAAMLSSTALSSSATGISGNAYSAGAAIAGGLSGSSGGSMGISGGSSTMATGGGGGTTTGGAPAGAAPSSSSSNANIALAKKLAGAYGWGSGAEWNSLYAMWSEESGFNNTNQNPTSTAYGIAQFLDSTWGGTGYSKTSDPTTQIEAGLKYIKNRGKQFHDPVSAWDFHKRKGYYAQGAFEVQQDQDARVHAGEMIVDAPRAEKVRKASRAGGSGGGGAPVVINIYPQTIDEATVAKVVAAVKSANKTDGLTMALMMGDF